MTSETILVIDDSHEIANFLAGKVLPELGYQTLVAYDGKTALDFIYAHGKQIDALLVDFQLPDMSGLDLLRQAKESGHNIPAIIATAHGSEEIVVDAFHIGVQDYLKKPLDPQELERILKRILTENRLRREKKSLTDQLQQQVRRLMALYQVGKSVTSSLELDEVLPRIVEAGVLLTQAEEGFLALLDQQSEQLYLRAAKNIDEEKSKTLRLPVNDSLIGSVLHSAHPLRTTVKAQSDSPLKVATGYLVNSLLHVPILSRGKALGVLSVDNRINTHEFHDVDEALLSSLADYAAVAIENAHLYQQAQEELVQRKEIEKALRISEERFALAVRGANDGIWDWDLHSKKVYFSPRWKAMLGYQETEIGDHIDEWLKRVHPDDRERVRLELQMHIQGTISPFESEYRILHKDGGYRWVLSRGLGVQDHRGDTTRIAGSQTDITTRKLTEEKLLHDAFHDALTSLPNRALLLDRLSYAVERAKRRAQYLFALLFLDLDRFKDVNDTLGHTIGDDLLHAVARLLKGLVRPIDTVARLGGDEFVILLEDINSVHDATQIAERILLNMKEISLVKGYDVYMSTSIGIVLSTSKYQNAEDVLRDADIAMYRAKSLGKARYEIFDPAMRQQIMERIQLENDLRQAIERNELFLVYQPILSLELDRISGFEALLRWQHPRLGLLSPDKFIPMAEETGIIIALDQWVLNHACAQMSQWIEQYPFKNPLTVSVNFSGKQFSQPNLVEEITRVLQQTNLPPSCLNVEITESAIIEDHKTTLTILSRLQKLGVDVRIDDFGKGYSSLSYLSQFPINALKIDYIFVSTMALSSKHVEIVQSIVMLAHSMGLKVIAEGVETEKQLTQLKEMGCENAQGYFISRPLSHNDVPQFIESSAKKFHNQV